jgi:hypothetical protein
LTISEQTAPAIRKNRFLGFPLLNRLKPLRAKTKMENKSTNRNKALHDQIFDQWISRIKIRSQRETHFIGLGGGGTNAVKYLWSQQAKGRYTFVNKPERADIPAGINLIPFQSPKILKFTGTKGDIYFSDMEQPLELPAEFTRLFREDCRFVLLACLGGYTGTKMAEALSGMLQKEQRDFLTICSMPFSFEGTSRLANAHEAMNLALSEAFPAADWYFYKIISKLRVV